MKPTRRWRGSTSRATSSARAATRSSASPRRSRPWTEPSARWKPSWSRRCSWCRTSRRARARRHGRRGQRLRARPRPEAVLDFKPQDHVEVGTSWGWSTSSAATKLSGSRFVLLRGDGRAADARADGVHARPAHRRARLHRDLAARAGNGHGLRGTGQLPKFGGRRVPIAGLGRVGDRQAGRGTTRSGVELYLIPTAEVPLTNLHARRNPRGAVSCRSVLRVHAVLPQRGRQLRQGHARDDPRAPVRQGRAGALRAPGAGPRPRSRS